MESKTSSSRMFLCIFPMFPTAKLARVNSAVNLKSRKKDFLTTGAVIQLGSTKGVFDPKVTALVV